MKQSTEKVVPIIWAAFLISVVIYIGILFSIFGGLSLIEDLDYHRIFLFNNPVALSLYVISTLALGAYFVVPNFIISTSDRKKAFTGFILRLALLESICLYGFILGIIQQDIQAAIPFFIMSFVGIFTMNPFTKLKDISPKPTNPTTLT